MSDGNDSVANLSPGVFDGDGVVRMKLQASHIETDVLVLGGGLAAYRAALAARARGAKVLMVYRARGASPYIIGFNAPLGHVDRRDTPDIYYDDIVRGGYYLNDRRLVRVLADQASAVYHELQSIGVPFVLRDDGSGMAQQRHLSGNTYARSVFIAEGTGTAIMNAMHARAREIGVEMLSGLRVLDLLRDGGEVVGALLCTPHTYALTTVRARSVVVALGGVGRLYADSTYPADVNADGLSLSLEAGASLLDMEFVQFEPLVVMWPEGCRGMEMPTAMLGDGAQMRNRLGERFMLSCNPPHGEQQIEKARMSLFIQREIDEGRGFPEGGVAFDATMLTEAQRESYVSHCRRLRASGVDPAVATPLVAPAAHSMMGGVAVDERCWSGVPGLYIGGESAGGVHGASRIAGNGCSDTLVFGGVAGDSAAADLASAAARDWHAIEAQALARLTACIGQPSGKADAIDTAHNTIRRTVAQAAGIWRSQAGLDNGLSILRSVAEELRQTRAPDLAGAIALREARRLAAIGSTVIDAALQRTESRGAHQRTDFPETDDGYWLRHIGFHADPDGRIVSRHIAIQ